MKNPKSKCQQICRQTFGKKSPNSFTLVLVANFILSAIAPVVLCFSIAENSLLPRIQVTSPNSINDWKQLASLLVAVFDDDDIKFRKQTEKNDSSKPSIKDQIDNFQWQILGRQDTENFVLNRYLKTAKQMYGKKHAILIAKDVNVGAGGIVLGMAEMGISSTYQESDEKKNDESESSIRKVVTVGVLGVAPQCQRFGIGNLLLAKCEEIALSPGWNEDSIHVAVDPNNTNALNFFRKQGYDPVAGRPSMVTVRRKKSYEERPHLMFCKKLTKMDPATL